MTRIEPSAEDIEEILAEIDGDQIEEYQKFFDAFDRGKQGYIMATQIGQIMHAMEQDFDEKLSVSSIKRSVYFFLNIYLIYILYHKLDKKFVYNILKLWMPNNTND
uniref:EF-hand domain-containing protein n=1 Tax=Heterorhabditis bacteriophora TaxID=37862 RepID=A0A1I7X4Y2_HETBA